MTDPSRFEICFHDKCVALVASRSVYENTDECVRLQFLGLEMILADGGPPLPVMRCTVDCGLIKLVCKDGGWIASLRWTMLRSTM